MKTCTMTYIGFMLYLYWFHAIFISFPFYINSIMLIYTTINHKLYLLVVYNNYNNLLLKISYFITSYNIPYYRIYIIIQGMISL